MGINLKDKTVVVTGAGSGIGRALALALTKEGANLALSDINEDALGATVTLCRQVSDSQKISQDKLDVSDRQAFFSYAEKVVQEFGEVHGVINNAGVAVMCDIEDVEFDDFEWIMGINFWGMVYGTKAFLPHLRKSSPSFVLNISSIFGIVAAAGNGTYNASKFAIRGFTEALRQELVDTDITVISVHPGGINTSIADVARLRGDYDKDDVENFKKILVHSPEFAAKTIVNGIKKQKNRVLIGYDAKLLDFFQRLMPVKYDKVIKLLAGRDS